MFFGWKYPDWAALLNVTIPAYGIRIIVMQPDVADRPDIAVRADAVKKIHHHFVVPFFFEKLQVTRFMNEVDKN
jgi:hypothetical protein